MKPIVIPVALAFVTCLGASAIAAGPTAVENKQVAERAATRLLQRFVPPPRATRLAHEPRGDRGFLGRRTLSIGGQNVYKHSFWRVPERLDSVIAFVKNHPPKRMRHQGGGTSGGSGIPANKSLDFLLPRSSFALPARWIEVTMAALSDGSTGIRVDAVAGWIIPRPSGEKVPAGVREIDIHSRHRSTHVTQAAKVHTIVRWFDALNIVQSGPIFSCPALIGGSRVVFDFRSAHRVLLARARLNSGGISTQCNPIEFSIGGRIQTPLVGLTFWRRVKRLVGLTNPS
jgi:hypothetical protein